VDNKLPAEVTESLQKLVKNRLNLLETATGQKVDRLPPHNEKIVFY
jgi:hypothetical protein